MHKANSVPRTFAAKPPAVDKFVKDYLKSRYPKQDSKLAKLQSVMLKVCGPMTWVQDGGIAHVTIPTPAGSLYGQDRPKGCIFNSPGGQRFTNISGLPRPRGSPVSVQSATIQTLHCSLHIHKTNKTASPVLSRSWNPDIYLPGRHALKRAVQATTSGTSFHSHLAVDITGIRNQCAEISPDSIETNRLLGVHNQYQHITTSSAESGDTEGDSAATQMPLHTDTDTCMSVGKTHGNKASSIHRPLHYHALQSLKISALHAQQETVALSPEATNNLKW